MRGIVTNKEELSGPEKFATIIIGLFLCAFVAMFIVGGLHDHLDDRVPDASYWASLFLVWAVAFFGTLFRKGMVPDAK